MHATSTVAPKSTSTQHSPAAHGVERCIRSQQHAPTSTPLIQPVEQHPSCPESRALSGNSGSVHAASAKKCHASAQKAGASPARRRKRCAVSGERHAICTSEEARPCRCTAGSVRRRAFTSPKPLRPVWEVAGSGRGGGVGRCVPSGLVGTGSEEGIASSACTAPGGSAQPRSSRHTSRRTAPSASPPLIRYRMHATSTVAPKSTSTQHSPAAHGVERCIRSQQHAPTSTPLIQPVEQHPSCPESRALSGNSGSVHAASAKKCHASAQKAGASPARRRKRCAVSGERHAICTSEEERPCLRTAGRARMLQPTPPELGARTAAATATPSLSSSPTRMTGQVQVVRSELRHPSGQSSSFIVTVKSIRASPFNLATIALLGSELEGQPIRRIRSSSLSEASSAASPGVED